MKKGKPDPIGDFTTAYFAATFKKNDEKRRREYRAKEATLMKFMLNPVAPRYFKGEYKFRMGVLACVVEGGKLADVADRYGQPRRAASAEARRARRIFGIPKKP